MRIDLTIRQAIIEDIPACSAIYNAWLDETPWMPRLHSRDEVESYCRKVIFPQQDLHVACIGPRVAGYMALGSDDFINQLFVASAHRCSKIGKELLDYAKILRPNRITLWTFIANRGARHFYRREGFFEAERTAGNNEEKLPDIRFEWLGGSKSR